MSAASAAAANTETAGGSHQLVEKQPISCRCFSLSTTALSLFKKPCYGSRVLLVLIIPGFYSRPTKNIDTFLPTLSQHDMTRYGVYS